MNNIICNVDTDAIMIAKPDGAPWSKEEQQAFLDALNAEFPEKINFEHDGYYTSVVIVKSKNYALLPEGSDKIKTKGSSIRDQKKEPAMREMMDKMIHAMIYDQQDTLTDIYLSYIKEALKVTDIKRWCQKKSITEAVLECRDSDDVRKNESDVWDAVKAEPGVQMGDKIYVYPVILETQVTTGRVSEKTGKPLKDKKKEINGLRLDKYWNNDHNVDKLIERCYSTVCIFESVLDMSKFTDYSTAKNKKRLKDL